MGIEPTFEAWEAPVLPLNYTRNILNRQQFTEVPTSMSPPNGRGMVLADKTGIGFLTCPDHRTWG